MTQNVYIRLASQRVDNTIVAASNIPRLYTPGEIITCMSGFMRGHGTYMEEDALTASVAGVVEQVNKLISVRPIKNRYNGEVGDVIVGRITEVQQKRWKVDTNSRLDSVLLLSSVNLPGGELRRRSVEDEHMMRKYLKEGDLISAEVQKVYDDGSLSLYTRSLKYGKLCQGVLVKVFPSLVKRCKNHFHNLPCGASIIIGNNGFIWICPTINDRGEDGLGGFTENLKEFPRLNVVSLLSFLHVLICKNKPISTLFPHFHLSGCSTCRQRGNCALTELCPCSCKLQDDVI
ncbi:exosome complex component RRP4 isoform X2 [Zootermopsis nevadensis]|uniref:exosome complex component RRP4 isoform X2 n=1 Tax=Zootermopsis nevadensis TaxID=136037 RepID=UPI000B8E21E9|nr:exosome complex component RRP4 isoform X2 [Zootermopsis nevadensis]XP_021922563.1 exosome complex component RRP4 isoform X2 [Zootermopsis nevadensis]